MDNGQRGLSPITESFLRLRVKKSRKRWIIFLFQAGLLAFAGYQLVKGYFDYQTVYNFNGTATYGQFGPEVNGVSFLTILSDGIAASGAAFVALLVEVLERFWRA